MKRDRPSLWAALTTGVLVNVLLRSQSAYWPRAGALAALVCAPLLAAAAWAFARAWRAGQSPLLRLLFAALLAYSAALELLHFWALTQRLYTGLPLTVVCLMLLLPGVYLRRVSAISQTAHVVLCLLLLASGFMLLTVLPRLRVTNLQTFALRPADLLTAAQEQLTLYPEYLLPALWPQRGRQKRCPLLRLALAALWFDVGIHLVLELFYGARCRCASTPCTPPPAAGRCRCSTGWKACSWPCGSWHCAETGAVFLRCLPAAGADPSAGERSAAAAVPAVSGRHVGAVPAAAQCRPGRRFAGARRIYMGLCRVDRDGRCRRMALPQNKALYLTGCLLMSMVLSGCGGTRCRNGRSCAGCCLRSRAVRFPPAWSWPTRRRRTRPATARSLPPARPRPRRCSVPRTPCPGQAYYGLLDLAALPAQTDWQTAQQIGTLLYDVAQPAPELSVFALAEADGPDWEEEAPALYDAIKAAESAYEVHCGLQQLFAQNEVCAVPALAQSGYDLLLLPRDGAPLRCRGLAGAQLAAVLCGQAQRLQGTFAGGQAACEADAHVTVEGADRAAAPARLHAAGSDGAGAGRSGKRLAAGTAGVVRRTVRADAPCRGRPVPSGFLAGLHLRPGAYHAGPPADRPI